MTATATPDAMVVVNGPEGVLPGWDAIDWRAAEDDVRRLRQRIFTVSKAGDLAFPPCPPAFRACFSRMRGNVARADPDPVFSY
jgi:hypothetical protein